APSAYAGLGFHAVSRLALRPIVGDALDRDHALVRIRLEDAHTLRVAPRDAHVVHRAADELPAVRHQHDLVALLDRERGDEVAVAIVDDHRDDAFAAASAGAV